MAVIEGLRVDAVEVTHPGGQAGLRRFDDEVEVVAHEAVGVANPLVPLDNTFEERQEALPIVIIEEDRALRVPARGDVIARAGELEPQRARHHANVNARSPRRLEGAAIVTLSLHFAAKREVSAAGEERQREDGTDGAERAGDLDEP